MRCLLIAVGIMALLGVAAAVPNQIHPLAHKMRYPQQAQTTSVTETSASSTPSAADLFKISPDFVVPFITVDFKPDVKVADALQKVTEVIKSTKQSDSHFLVAANFDAAEIEKSNALLAKAANAESQLVQDLAKLGEKTQGKSVLQDPKVQERIKNEKKVDSFAAKLKSTDKSKFSSNVASLKQHFMFASGAKASDLKIGASYTVRVETKTLPDDGKLELLKKALAALAKDFSKVEGVAKAYVTKVADNPFPCIAPGHGNTPCEPSEYVDVPDLSTWQATYLDDQTGVKWSVMRAKNIPGTDGANTRVIDIESAFNAAHVNLPAVTKVAAQGKQPAEDYPVSADNVDHGTAVLGMLVATGKIGGNGPKGIKGMVPASRPYFATRYIKPAGALAASIDPGAGVERVVDNLNPTYGDVVVLEMQHRFSDGNPFVTCGTNGEGQGPVEAITAVRDKIRVALANGAVVVAAGGNGAVDLDDADCKAFFKTNDHSIIVGAANSAARNNKQVRPDSAKGSRIDVYAVGNDIATLGYGAHSRSAFKVNNVGAAPVPNSPNHEYMAAFGATSGATPQVAATAVAMAGIMKHYDLQIPAGTFQSIIRSTSGPAVNGAAHGSGGLLDADGAVDKMLATVRKCRYCQFSLARTIPLDIAIPLMTTADAMRFTCSKLGAEKNACEDFIKDDVINSLFFAAPWPAIPDPTFGSFLADIIHTMFGKYHSPTNAEAVRVIDSVCTSAVVAPCKLTEAHYGAWTAQHATHGFLANSATRALSA